MDPNDPQREKPLLDPTSPSNSAEWQKYIMAGSAWHDREMERMNRPKGGSRRSRRSRKSKRSKSRRR